MKVLLVDDSTTMRRIQKNQLTKLGIAEVLEAEDGEDALKQLDENMPFDVVFLDWNMPVMDGFTLLKKLRSMDAYKTLRVIMCTSESEKESVMEALQAGASDYIVKPFTQEILKQKLNL